ncbi:hypothetical protein [Nocardia abscessus]|nr:hypothetical protein [Nocardia abscessus]
MAAQKRRRKPEKTPARESGLRVSIGCSEYLCVLLLVLLLTH